MDVVGAKLDTNWQNYKHVSVKGIVRQSLLALELADLENTELEVKHRFIELLKKELAIAPLVEINGANRFLKYLRSQNRFRISIATGGWLESALCKLKSANMECSDIPIASSNDHYARTEIMKMAALKSGAHYDEPFVYFGDGIWDKAACDELSFHFTLVGVAFPHETGVKDYRNVEEVLKYINK